MDLYVVNLVTIVNNSGIAIDDLDYNTDVDTNVFKTEEEAKEFLVESFKNLVLNNYILSTKLDEETIDEYLQTNALDMINEEFDGYGNAEIDDDQTRFSVSNWDENGEGELVRGELLKLSL